MNILRPASLVFFALLCMLALRPFTAHNVVLAAGTDRTQPLGEVIAGFVAEEHVPALGPLRGYAGGADCIALRFATYKRHNAGAIDVFWQQGQHAHRWRVDAAKLADNSYLDLCMQHRIDPALPFRLRVSGVDGVRGASATVWTSTARTHALLVGGERRDGRGLTFRLTHEKRMLPADILGIRHGMFALGALLLAMIGTLSLLFFCRAGAHPVH